MSDALFLSPDTDAEMGLIGAMLLDDRAAEIAINSLTSELFLNTRHRAAFDALSELYLHDGTLENVHRVASFLTNHRDAKSIGDPTRITGMIEGSSPGSVENFVSSIKERSQKNRLKELGVRLQEWANNGASSAEILSNITELASKLEAAGAENYRPQIRSVRRLLDNPLPPRDILIESIAFCGSKISMSAPSKARKSFLQQHLAVCVATGRPWYNFKTKKGPVLYMNLELAEETLQTRFGIFEEKLFGHAGVIEDGYLDYLQLRGRRINGKALREFTETYITPGRYDLIIVDPLYKLMAGLDENKAGDVAEILGELEAMATRARAALLICHHFAKGSAAGKNMLDRASGSGVVARDGDTMITLTPHEEDPEDVYTLEFALRDLPPVSPVVLRWSYPVFEIDNRLSPCQHAKAGAARKWTPQDVGRIAGEGQGHGDLCQALQDELSISNKTARRAIIEAIKAGHVSNALGVYRQHVKTAPAEEPVQEGLFG